MRGPFILKVGLKGQRKEDECISKSLRNLYVDAKNICQRSHKSVQQETDECNSCLLLETKALCEILHLWSAREGRKTCTYLFFPWFLLISELQETKPPWELMTSITGNCLFDGWFCCARHFRLLSFILSNTCSLFPSPLFSGKIKWKNKGPSILKKKEKKEIISVTCWCVLQNAFK